MSIPGSGDGEGPTPGVTAGRRRPGATAHDVARLAGVSQSTVSLVFSGKHRGRVGGEVRARVLEAATSLGYRPKVAGRNLRLGRSSTLALAIPDIENPVFARMLSGATTTARASGFGVVLVDMRQDDAWASLLADGLGSGTFDGAILHTPDPDALDMLLDAGPVVLVEGSAPGVPGVELGVEAGVRAAVEHLLALGHRRIAHVAADYDKETFRLRRREWRRLMEAEGLPLVEAATRWDVDLAEPAIAGILRTQPRPTALLCDDDLLAAAAYRAARASGLAIPGDLSVIGFDDIPLARLLDPQLTTVRMPADAIGSAAAGLLLALIDGAEPPAAAIHIELPLTVRRSTAAAPTLPRRRDWPQRSVTPDTKEGTS